MEEGAVQAKIGRQDQDRVGDGEVACAVLRWIPAPWALLPIRHALFLQRTHSAIWPLFVPDSLLSQDSLHRGSREREAPGSSFRLQLTVP